MAFFENIPSLSYNGLKLEFYFSTRFSTQITYMSFKTTDGLMRHLRDNGINIAGSV